MPHRGIDRTAVINEEEEHGGSREHGKNGADQLDRLEEGLEHHQQEYASSPDDLKSDTMLTAAGTNAERFASGNSPEPDTAEMHPCYLVHGDRWGPHGSVACGIVQLVLWTIVFLSGAYFSCGVQVDSAGIVWFPPALLIGAVCQSKIPFVRLALFPLAGLSTFAAIGTIDSWSGGIAAFLASSYMVECAFMLILLWRLCGVKDPQYDSPWQIVALAFASAVASSAFAVIRSAVLMRLLPGVGPIGNLIEADFPRDWLGMAMIIPITATASMTAISAWWASVKLAFGRRAQELTPGPSPCPILGMSPGNRLLLTWIIIVGIAAALPSLFNQISTGLPIIVECTVMTSFPIMLCAGVTLGIPGLTTSTVVSIVSLAIMMDTTTHGPTGSPGMPNGDGLARRGNGIGAAIESATAFDSLPRLRLWRTLFMFAALFVVAVVADKSRVLRSVERLVTEQTSVIQGALDDAAKARDAEREANRHKAGFLAFLCHELRNPLHAILNMSTFLLEELSSEHPASGSVNDAETQQDMDRSAQAIGLASEYMLSLINDTLDMGRFEAGDVHLHRVPVNFRRLLDDTIIWARDLVKGQEVDVIVNVDDNVPTCVVIDPVRSQQVINNLIINAYKFSPPQSRITIEVSATSTAPAPSLHGRAVSQPVSKKPINKNSVANPTHTIRLAVSDMGPSLTSEQIALVFQPYAIQTQSSREYGGSGLGLAITNEISRLMGGRIDVEAGRSGTGSVFTFELPVVQVADTMGHALKDKRPSPMATIGNTMLLQGKKSVERNVAAARFDELTKQLTDRPLVARALELSVGVGAQLDQKKTFSLLQKDSRTSTTSLTVSSLGRPPKNSENALNGKNVVVAHVGKAMESGRSIASHNSDVAAAVNASSDRVSPRPSSGFWGSDEAIGTGGRHAATLTKRRRTAEGQSLGIGTATSSRNNSPSRFPDAVSREIHALLIDGDKEPVQTLSRCPSPVMKESPIEIASNRSSIVAPPPPQSDAILVVDDSGINRRILCRHLSRMTDLPIHQAADGQEAIKAYGAHLAPRYAIIFMDLMMPNVDGHEATRRIRDMGCTAPIVATTASVVPGEEVQAMIHLAECGMSQALPKPFTKEQIEDILRAYQVRMLDAPPPSLNRKIEHKQPPIPTPQTVLSPLRAPSPPPATTVKLIPPTPESIARSTTPPVNRQSDEQPGSIPSPNRVPSANPFKDPPRMDPNIDQAVPKQRIAFTAALLPDRKKLIRKSHSVDGWKSTFGQSSEVLLPLIKPPSAFHGRYSTAEPPTLHRHEPHQNAGSEQPSVSSTGTFHVLSNTHGCDSSTSGELKGPVPIRIHPPPATDLLSGGSGDGDLFPVFNLQPSSLAASVARLILNPLPSIPAPRLSKTQSDPPTPTRSKSFVLVVDDSSISRGMLSKILTMIGPFETHDAINGIEALQRCFWTTYSIIFMDLEMPRMGGQEATARIRSTGYTGPIIVITAHPLDSLPRGLATVGVTECLSKPITRDTLMAVLKRYRLLHH
ncbi:hypothetical protein HKX48_007640 [Thoreauomyces humboldtii]|nr:hypothetical protein HKX48_007640 [Thoreauomyces humboldtii]